MSSDLGVSRLILRAALDDLVRDGYLERRHGSGTLRGDRYRLVAELSQRRDRPASVTPILAAAADRDT